MADIKPTQTAIMADTSGLAQGVQTDTSALRDANTRGAALASDIFTTGAEIASAAAGDNALEQAEALDKAFFEQADTSDLEDRKALFEDVLDEDKELADEALAGIQKEIDRKVRAKGQMSSSQYDLLMEVGMKEAINKAPWAEKTIASMYGKVSGRNKAILKLLDTQTASATKQQERIAKFNTSYITKHGLMFTGDQDVDHATVQKHQGQQVKVNNILAKGTEGSGFTGFTDNIDSFIAVANSDIGQVYNRFENTTDPQDKVNGINAIKSAGEAIKAQLRGKYGNEVPTALYVAEESRIDAMVQLQQDRLSGEKSLKELDARNKLIQAQDSNFLLTNSNTARTASALSGIMGDRTASELIGAMDTDSTMLKELFTISTLMLDGNYAQAATMNSNISPENRKGVAKLNQAYYQADVNRRGRPVSKDEAVPDHEIVSETMNATAKMVSDPSLPYNKDTFMSIANVTSGENFFRLSSEGFRHFDTQALSDFAKTGGNDSLGQARDKIQAAGLIEGNPMTEYLQLDRSNDGRLSFSTRNTGFILSRAGGVQGGIEVRQINDFKDMLNRTHMDMLNAAVRTEAHLGGHKNYQDVSDRWLTEYNIESVVPVGFEMQQAVVQAGGGVAPGVTVESGVVTRDQPAPTRQAPTITIDRSPLQGEVPQPRETTAFPTTGVEFDIDALTELVNTTPASDMTVREGRLRSFENSPSNPKGGWTGTVWTPHASIEGGTATLAYGHKLTASEADGGTVRIGNQDVDYTKGLTDEQAQSLFQQDWTKAQQGANTLVKKNKLQSIPRRAKLILAEMVYQMGAEGVSGFKMTLKALADGDYTKAAKQMRNSKWYKQTTRRAEILATEMEGLDK